ncbi:hypothetical protein [Methylibium sp.]|uniref:hypothetical protein n=1 Tax=Methylibium sp. TaxID=2067992 RepID=UPI00286A845F|nr:hypothetical protein [Methylibium sp.]
MNRQAEINAFTRAAHETTLSTLRAEPARVEEALAPAQAHASSGMHRGQTEHVLSVGAARRRAVEAAA